jgi:hypothetical protein
MCRAKSSPLAGEDQREGLIDASFSERRNLRASAFFQTCEVRMADQDIFDREMALEGGRVQIEKFPDVPAAPVYARTKEIAKELITSAKAVFPKLLPIYFDFVKNGTVNAWAFRSEDRYFIGLSSGALAMMHLVLNRMLANPNTFLKTGQPTEEDPNVPTIPWHIPDAEYLFKAGFRPVLPKCPRRAQYAQHLAEQALLFLIGHEIAHITRGHVDYLESSTGSAFLAELAWIGTSEARLERQAMEADADRRSVIARAYSMHETAQHIGDQSPPWATAPRLAEAWQYDWAFAVNTIFRLFGDPRFSVTIHGGSAILAAAS